MDFIDIHGASGTAYRFRPWPHSGAHPPIAGNYALVAADTKTPVELGMLDDLSQALSVLSRAPGAALFTRFNVSRRAREAEHADMTLHHPELNGATTHAA
jgi:hypothetical protein